MSTLPRPRQICAARLMVWPRQRWINSLVTHARAVCLSSSTAAATKFGCSSKVPASMRRPPFVYPVIQNPPPCFYPHSVRALQRPGACSGPTHQGAAISPSVLKDQVRTRSRPDGAVGETEVSVIGSLLFSASRAMPLPGCRGAARRPLRWSTGDVGAPRASLPWQ